MTTPCFSRPGGSSTFISGTRTAHLRNLPRASAGRALLLAPNVTMLSSVFHSGEAAHFSFDTKNASNEQTLSPSADAAASALAAFADAFNAEAADKLMCDVLQASPSALPHRRGSVPR